MKRSLRLLMLLLLALCLLGCSRQSDTLSYAKLSKQFASPPDDSRIWVYWFWLNGNISEEGITADLEAMKRVGIGGVLIMEVDQGAPVGPVDFMGDEWRRLFTHMIKEAKRLGLQVNMNDDAGWNGSGGPWVPIDKSMQMVVTSQVDLAAGEFHTLTMPLPEIKENYYRDIALLAFPAAADTNGITNQIPDLGAKNMSWSGIYAASLEIQSSPKHPEDLIIQKDNILDLSTKMDSTGTLTWEAPALPASSSGMWTVIRFGHTFTGAKNHPAPATGIGYECDKLSKEGIEAAYNGMIGQLVKDVSVAAGKTFISTHVDSWEIGSQNWTLKMAEEFKRLRGYDMIPYLPVMTGRIIDNKDISERFLRDLRQTVSDLLSKNYIGHLKTLANRDGLKLSMEAYSTPANDLDVANHIDEPISEFWWPGGGGFYWTQKSMSSVAHVNGLPIVGAESFTAGSQERWLAHPGNIKFLGDRAFCDGINRFIVHRYAMQPWVEDRRPGMTMGPWGLHYERTQTWWEESKAWHEYVARCQYMLRQGSFVADVLSLQSEEPMKRFSPLNLHGYDYDGISPEAFLQNVFVENGFITLNSGMSYKLLVLPDDDEMSVAMIEKVAELVNGGAVILGTPPDKAPGLSGYPAADQKVKEIAEKLWGTDKEQSRKVGKGVVMTGYSVEEALMALSIHPDFTSGRALNYIHRKAGSTDIFFVANPKQWSVDATCSFRVGDKSPEIWDPVSGEIQPASVYKTVGGRTEIPLSFEPSGSLFVVFSDQKNKTVNHPIGVTSKGKEMIAETQAEPSMQAEPAQNDFTMMAWVYPLAKIDLPVETILGADALSCEQNNVVYPAPGHEIWSDHDAGAGFGVGQNGVCVYEHSANYYASVLVYPTPVKDWTHVAIVYHHGQASLYLNGELVHQGLQSRMMVHGGMGARHQRTVDPFRGLSMDLKQIAKAPPQEEILSVMTDHPDFPEVPTDSPINFTTGEITQKGSFDFTTENGETIHVDAFDLPLPYPVKGPWEVTFSPGWGAPERVILDTLISWSDHQNPGIKYFSGSANYKTSFDFHTASLSDPALKPVIWLDLGEVAVMAEIKINGKDLGILWKTPYRINITEAIQEGSNSLDIKVVNLMINRMIGDEQLPEDSERNENGTLKMWPQWLQEGKESPTGRYTFTSWRLWDKEAPLQPSGLIGPVTIRVHGKVISL